MPVSPLRSQSVHDDAFAVEARPRRRRPPARSRSARAGLVPAHLALELLFGVALAVVPALLALPLGLAALAAIMGALIAVTAISSPAVRVPMRDPSRTGMGMMLPATNMRPLGSIPKVRSWTPRPSIFWISLGSPVFWSMA